MQLYVRGQTVTSMLDQDVMSIIKNNNNNIIKTMFFSCCREQIRLFLSFARSVLTSIRP